MIGVAGHGCIAAATAADTEILPRILDFFEKPRTRSTRGLFEPVNGALPGVTANSN